MLGPLCNVVFVIFLHLWGGLNPLLLLMNLCPLLFLCWIHPVSRKALFWVSGWSLLPLYFQMKRQIGNEGKVPKKVE